MFLGKPISAALAFFFVSFLSLSAWSQVTESCGVVFLEIIPKSVEPGRWVDQLSFSIVDQNGRLFGNTRIERCFQGVQKPIFPTQQSGNLYQISNLPLIYRSLYLAVEDTSNRETYQWKSETHLIEPNQLFQWDINQVFLHQIDFTKHQVLNVEMRKSEALLFSMWSDLPMSLEGEVVSKDKWIERRLVERNGWLFEKIWFWTESVQESNLSNRFDSKPQRDIQTWYAILDVATEQRILSLQGERYSDPKSAVFRHPEIRDVNFDGLPDLIVPKHGDAPQGNDYFAFNKEKARFLKLSISDLSDVTIDYVQQEVRGNYHEYGFPKTAPIAKVDVMLKGAYWKTRKLSRLDLTPPVNNANSKSKKEDFRLVSDGFIVELWTTDESDQIILESSLGVYAQKLMVKQLSDGALIYEHFIQGNVSEEIGMHRDFLIVKDFNMDGIADVYFPRLNSREKDRFALSDWSSDGLHYYTTIDFSYSQLVKKYQPRVPILGWVEWEDYNLDGDMDWRVLGPNDRWMYYTWNKQVSDFQPCSSLNAMDYCVVSSVARKAMYWKSSESVLGVKTNPTFYCTVGGEVIPDRAWLQTIKQGNAFECVDWCQGRWVISGEKYH
jgi:hypothetical protein